MTDTKGVITRDTENVYKEEMLVIHYLQAS